MLPRNHNGVFASLCHRPQYEVNTRHYNSNLIGHSYVLFDHVHCVMVMEDLGFEENQELEIWFLRFPSTTYLFLCCDSKKSEGHIVWYFSTWLGSADDSVCMWDYGYWIGYYRWRVGIPVNVTATQSSGFSLVGGSALDLLHSLTLLVE